MEKIEILEANIKRLKYELFFLKPDNENFIPKKQELKSFEDELKEIRLSQNKYIIRVISEFGDKWINPFYSNQKYFFDMPINLSQPNIPNDLLDFKLEIENYLSVNELIDMSKVKQIFFKHIS